MFVASIFLFLTACDYNADYYSNNVREVKKAVMLAPENINRITQHKTTPLIHAVKENRPKTVAKLINNGANIEATDDTGNTALWHALKMFDGKYSIIKKKSKEKRNEIVAFLIEHGADVNAGHSSRLNFKADSALSMALEQCDYDTAMLLIDNGAIIGINELWSAKLMWSFASSSEEYMSFCDIPEHKFNFMFYTMLWNLDYDDASRIINNNEEGTKRTVLSAAINDGYSNIATEIIKNSKCYPGLSGKYYLDINLQSISGETALMAAARTGNTEIVKLLMYCEPDLNIKNERGQTALMIAQENGAKDIVEILSAK